MRFHRYIASLLLLLTIAAAGNSAYTFIHQFTHHHEHHEHTLSTSSESVCCGEGCCCKKCHIELGDAPSYTVTKSSSAPRRAIIELQMASVNSIFLADEGLSAHSSPEYEDHAPWRLYNNYLSSARALRAPPLLS